MLVVPMATELRVPAVEVSLPRRFWLLWVFGKVDGDDFGVDFGEDSVRCFCLLCFGSGGREAFAGDAFIGSGAFLFSVGGGMRPVWPPLRDACPGGVGEAMAAKARRNNAPTPPRPVGSRLRCQR